MKCPKCEEKMTVISESVSQNKKRNKKYSCAIYKCDKDDVWINLEIPLESSSKK